MLLLEKRGMKGIESNLFLKKLEAPTDASHLYHLIATSREQLKEWLPSWSKVDSIAALKTRIAKHEQSDFYWGEDQYGVWFDQVLIGQVNLHSGEMTEKTVEFFYFLGTAYWGKGYMLRACTLLITKVFEETPIQQIIIRCHPKNDSSQKLAQRLQFELKETNLRRHTFVLDKKKWALNNSIPLYFLWFREIH